MSNSNTEYGQQRSGQAEEGADVQRSATQRASSLLHMSLNELLYHVLFGKGASQELGRAGWRPE